MKPRTTDDLHQLGTTPFTRSVGAELRRAMTEAGVTQVELAARTGVPRRNISGILTGKKNTTITRLEVLFTALGYDLAASATPRKKSQVAR